MSLIRSGKLTQDTRGLGRQSRPAMPVPLIVETAFGSTVSRQTASPPSRSARYKACSPLLR